MSAAWSTEIGDLPSPGSTTPTPVAVEHQGGTVTASSGGRAGPGDRLDGTGHLCELFYSAAAAASATAWSCVPWPPLTPTAPTTWPSRVSGIPPAKIMTLPSLEALIP